jgi:hypothetical protein
MYTSPGRVEVCIRGEILLYACRICREVDHPLLMIRGTAIDYKYISA